MRILLSLILALSLSACATFSGTRGQFVTTENVAVTGATTSFSDRVIAIGERLGYQYSGGDRTQNSVRLTDQPNFGQSVLGRSFSVQLTVTLNSDGRSVRVEYTSIGQRQDGARNSEERLNELRVALQSEFAS